MSDFAQTNLQESGQDESSRLRSLAESGLLLRSPYIGSAVIALHPAGVGAHENVVIET